MNNSQTEYSGGMKHIKDDFVFGSSLHSIVRIEVLGRNSNWYKILANGKLYQSNLPVTVLPGEILLAKAINLNPIKLQLNDLINSDLDYNTLTYLLDKLDIEITDISMGIIKILLKDGKPVIKSSIENLINLIEKKGKNAVSSNLEFLVKLFSDPINYSKVNESNLQYFKVSIDQLVNQIFSSFVKLITESSISAEINDLANIIVLNLEKENGKMATYEDNELLNWTKKNLANKRDDILKLAVNIFSYLYQKMFFLETGQSPEFFVLKNDDKYDLVYYNFQSKKIENGSRLLTGSYDFNNQFSEPVHIEGIDSGNNLNINVSLNKKKQKYTAAQMKLKKHLVRKTSLNVNVDFSDKSPDEYLKINDFHTIDRIN